jgi:hypothetical protein
LATFCGDTLEILLCSSVGVANLEKKAFLANGLTMELLDDLFADLTVLKAVHRSVLFIHWRVSTYRAKPTPRLI